MTEEAKSTALCAIGSAAYDSPRACSRHMGGEKARGQLRTTHAKYAHHLGHPQYTKHCHAPAGDSFAWPAPYVVPPPFGRKTPATDTCSAEPSRDEVCQESRQERCTMRIVILTAGWPERRGRHEARAGLG